MTIDPRGFGEEVVTLVVGEEASPLVIHKQLICEHSLFFKSSMKEEWQEGQDRTIPLPDDRVEVVTLYVQWAYQEKILSHGHPTMAEHDRAELDQLIDAFAFGEKIQDGRFRDAVLDALIACASTPDTAGARWFPAISGVKRAYQGTPESSPLPRLLVDLWARHAMEKWLGADMLPEFLFDLVRELLSLRQDNLPSHSSDGDLSSCVYHHHSDQRSCYRHASNESRSGPA
ncbi:hypothetical protein LTR33_001711 [Friedmanniomyces endolithicus]|nr:hypothetical protein LTR33_001711 [Friedmanniomyces endolithicus]